MRIVKIARAFLDAESVRNKQTMHKKSLIKDEAFDSFIQTDLVED
jgi:hypothetical protein